MDAPTIRLMTSSERQDYGTPPALFRAVERLFVDATGRGFDLDACAHSDNAKCDRYFDARQDGLAQSWGEANVWCNPPFKFAADWIKKSVDEAETGARVAVCLPARTDSNWFVDWAWLAAEIRFLTRRVTFTGARDSSPFPTVILVFDSAQPARSLVGPWDWKREERERAQPDLFGAEA